MRVVVYGLWHLGCVTAACLAEAGHDVVGLDVDPETVGALQGGRPPVLEPGLAELIAEGVTAGRLRFTTDATGALKEAEVLWVTLEAPLDDADRADVAFVRGRLETIASAVRPGTLVLISSQVPAGFTRDLESAWAGRGLRIACAPENLRLGQALEAFRRPERAVAGIRDESDRPRLAALFESLGVPVEWMSVESAETTKHAVNAYLATSVTFVNELARLCEAVGADARDVERGLRSEPRIGRHAYVSPGAPLSGGTLAREVRFLDALAHTHAVEAPLLSALPRSNAAHTRWLRQKIAVVLAGVADPRAAVLGLTYKAATDTLRRSASLELCRWLLEQGVEVRVHDPLVRELPANLHGRVALCASPEEAWQQADVAILATPWPQYRDIRPADLVAGMRRTNVFDLTSFLAASLGADARITYRAPGRPHLAGSGTIAPSATRPVGSPELHGRVAIVTGGSEGLGMATAALFLERGADVLISARREARLREAVVALARDKPAGRRVEWMAADAADPAAGHALVARAEALLGPVTILVNNAGVYGPMGRLEEVDWEQWVEAVRVNLLGTALMCRAVIPGMRARRYGKIINLSGGGATSPLPRISAYAAAKAAVVRLTETLAEELADARVDVNAIAPGPLNTRLLDEVLAAGTEKVGQEFYDQALQQHRDGGVPLARGAELAAFLASAASDGITGRLLSAVWDDWTSLAQQRERLSTSDVYTLRRIVPTDRGWRG